MRRHGLADDVVSVGACSPGTTVGTIAPDDARQVEARLSLRSLSAPVLVA
jgi:hypothetical protein